MPRSGGGLSGAERGVLVCLGVGLRNSLVQGLVGVIASGLAFFRGIVLLPFDPSLDITLDQNGLWRWATAKPELHQQVKAYFSSRKEDG